MSDKTAGEGMESRQKLMLAGLGVILLALIYFMFLRGAPPAEDGGIVGAQQPPPPIAQAETEDPFDPEAGQTNNQPVETFEVFASRDPFEPVIQNGSAGEGVEAPSENPAPGDPEEQGQTDPTDPEDGENTEEGEDPETDPGDEQEQETGPQANQEEVEGRSVTLIDVFREGGKDKAQVQVDSTGYTVAVGDVFAENFQLMSTSGQCATLLYGDDQFTLCEGDEILK